MKLERFVVLTESISSGDRYFKSSSFEVTLKVSEKSLLYSGNTWSNKQITLLFQSELSDELKALQERINTLPTGDEYRVMTDEERNTVYENAADISDDYTILPEGDRAKLDISKMEALFAVINEGTAGLNNTTPGLCLTHSY